MPLDQCSQRVSANTLQGHGWVMGIIQHSEAGSTGFFCAWLWGQARQDVCSEPTGSVSDQRPCQVHPSLPPPHGAVEPDQPDAKGNERAKGKRFARSEAATQPTDASHQGTAEHGESECHGQPCSSEPGPAKGGEFGVAQPCLLYTSPSPRDGLLSRMPSSA